MDSHPASPNRKIVFIVGVPRSGTTWLMWLLGQHPGVVCTNHAGYFHALKPFRSWWKQAVPAGKTVHVFEQNDPQAVEADYWQVRLNERLKIADFDSLILPLTEKVFEEILAAKPGASVAVDQTPENMLMAKMIRAILPEAGFLHIIRDPRAVVASMRQAVQDWADPGDFPSHPIQIAGIWNDYMEAGRSLEAIGANYFPVRYEDLKSDGPGRLADIFRWMGLESTAEDCKRYLEASSIDRMRDRQKTMPKGFFRRGKSDGWQDDLTPAQVRAIEIVTADWMQRLGYAPRYPGPAGRPWLLRSYQWRVRLRQITGGSLGSLLQKVARRLPFGKALLARIRAARRTQSGLEE